ncbi:FAD-dependent oxidoreductase [Mariluticola halotolerans]|uniref:FAD-dependent oxidoreductase n=1 Tax=Mariluticola halotolerans TaxID=2909283 RepID=UPI0026E33E08|nr:FAD-dependent oxidoreductase [Mariluticola halotolerans]UJQ96033.1 FAD-dependent oxidoreductase [Mariluticola halotolerans]
MLIGQQAKLNAEYDVIVLGAGAAGMAAAIFSALRGCKTLLAERTEFLGGTSALSAATTWVPNTRHASEVGAEDSRDKVLGYLDRAVGNRAPRKMREAFVDRGPEAIHTLEDATVVKFRPRPFHPDYLYELEGSTSCGRALEPYPFDAKALGDDLKLVRPPIPEFTILGGLMIDRDDIAHLLKMGKSLKSFAYAAKLVGSYYWQKMRFGRGTRLVMGNALIGRMLMAARQLNVDIVTNAKVAAIAPLGDRSHRLDIQIDGKATQTIAKNGVILASGGFSRHPQRRSEMLPHPLPPVSPAAPGHTGELHDIVMELGAHYAEGAAQPCFWAPVSIRKRADGTQASFPHFVLDRSKPGILTVDKSGRRFINESRSYHEFVSAMYAANKGSSTIPVYLICHAPALKKYGLGMVRPGAKNLKPYLDDGYLVRGDTLAELAGKIDIDQAVLAQTVKTFNTYAATGIDEEFGRGSTVYERANGDPEHGPNPTLGALTEGPFYAVRLWPGDIGSAIGLAADEHARILGQDGTPIPGLFVCGNDMNSIMGGVYPGPGITIGPGIVFGYIAAESACAGAAA